MPYLIEMVHVTHLLTPNADEQVRQIHSMLMPGLGDPVVSHTLRIGPGAARGIPGAVLHLRREKPDVIVAWGIKPLAAAVLASGRRILFSPERFAGPRALGWIKPIMQRADVTMICTSTTQRQLAIARGIDPDRCVLIPPGVDFDALPNHQDGSLRQELGFSPSDFVLIAPGESTLLSGHDHAVWASVIHRVIEPACKLLIWGRGPKAEGLQRLPGSLKLDLVTLAEQKLGRSISFEQLLGAADACLGTPVGMAPTLPLAMAMAAGVPIVAVKNSAISELLEDRQTALLVPGNSPRALVQQLIDLQADAALRARMVAQAKAVAGEKFAMGGMLSAWRELMMRAEGANAHPIIKLPSIFSGKPPQPPGTLSQTHQGATHGIVG